MTFYYDWHRKDALLRAKVAGARHLIARTASRDSQAERTRRQAALTAAEEALRVHQMNEPRETTVNKTADISPCGLYRWKLSRDWPTAHEKPGRVCFVMLNPSTADGTKDDPTLRMCIHFAQFWGFGGLDVVNLFPFRTSSPIECFGWVKHNTEGNVEIHNLNTVAQAVLDSSIVVAAWGATPWAQDMGRFVAKFIHRVDKPLLCLGTTQDGSPKHPLARGVHRIPRDAMPFPWKPKQEENDQ